METTPMRGFGQFWSEERGQALVETALLIAFIAIVCVLAVTEIGTRLSDLYNTIAGGFPG
jgi:Flp pilus assembly pilin Flp